MPFVADRGDGYAAVDDATGKPITHCPCCGTRLLLRHASALCRAILDGRVTMDHARALSEMWAGTAKKG